VDRSLKAVPQLLAGDMEKATMLIHTSKPPRPKPAPRMPPDSQAAPASDPKPTAATAPAATNLPTEADSAPL